MNLTTTLINHATMKLKEFIRINLIQVKVNVEISCSVIIYLVTLSNE